jgi:nitrate reductase beta subunit
MKVMAQMGMVMNLDKCIGCHTCSVTCKQAWTNRDGVEYVWFNNVETRPGLGYPRTYEDQDKWQGGWELNKRGRLKLKQGGRTKRLMSIFSNPKLPEVGDYYEPWTYDYETLLASPASKNIPVAQPKSALTDEPMQIRWSANWDDNLGGAAEYGPQDPIVKKIKDDVTDRISFEFEQAFMFYLPRICEHCLNPACVAACPSGAMYKRAEDGIVLVDQDACRGWRMCVTGCPYKKVYFNHSTGKAEKCTLCYPRIEAGQPTVCSETCVGRLRYLGLFLYDADRVTEAAATLNEQELYQAQLDLILDPHDPAVQEQARRDGIAEDWLEAAKKSPVYALAKDFKVALPLHPEYRTMPMVWYIPPLSPIVDALRETGNDAEDADNLFGALRSLRIPVEYLAELFTAGDVAPVLRSLDTLAAMRSYMRDINIGDERDASIPGRVGLSEDEMLRLYRLLAIAKYEERYVIPAAHAEVAKDLEDLACSLDGDGGPGQFEHIGGHDSHGGSPQTVSAESFHLLKAVQEEHAAPTAITSVMTDLPHWSGKGVAMGMPKVRVRDE